MTSCEATHVGKVASFEINRPRAIEVDGTRVLIVRIPEGLFAIENKCPHQSRSMVNGTIEARTLRCAYHRVCVDLATGELLDDGGYLGLSAVRTFTIEDRDGEAYLSLPDETQ